MSHTDIMVCVCVQVPLRDNWGRQQRPLNMNHYANKKSAAESMLDVALLMANASQLKAVLEQGSDFSFYVPLIALISISLILQIIVGVLLIFIGECVVSEKIYSDTKNILFCFCCTHKCVSVFYCNIV